MQWLVTLYAVLTTLAVGFAALLTLQTWEHRRFARSRSKHPNRRPPRGRIALFVPCKGADVDLESNLRPLFEQDHGNYELIFAVESLNDAACHTIHRLIAQYPGHHAKLIDAGISTVSGQKVHNLLVATEHLSSAVDILAFVDADVRPPRDWLRMLTQRLDGYGAATGYRWFVPKRATLANCMLSSMDSAVVPIMFPGLHHKVWGGSWAIRRDVFDTGRLRDAWRGTLSDDLVAASVLARTRQRVALEPSCILPSPLDVDLSGMFTFVRRQFTIGRCYTPVLWGSVLVMNCLSQVVFWSSLAAMVWGSCTAAEWTWTPASVVGLLYALHIVRAWLRQQASRHYLPNRQEELAAARQFDIWLGPLAGLACCLGLVGSAFGRRISWKGITYEMRWGGKIRQISSTATRVRPAEVEGLSYHRVA